MRPTEVWQLISSEDNAKTYKVGETYVTIQMSYDPVLGLTFTRSVKGEKK